MKFISLHSKNTSIVYKNALCSYATIVVLAFIISSVMIPVILVSLLSPYSGITSSRVLYEQPKARFKYQHIFVAETKEKDTAEKGLIACSTFPNLNAHFKNYSKHCESVKYWTTDLDHDTNNDIGHFELMLDALPGIVESFDLIIFFEAKLKHKCELTPPTLLTQHLIMPNAAQMSSGTILNKGELILKQYIEFTCPFLGSHFKTDFRDIILNENTTLGSDISQYEIESLLQQLKANPGYFQLNIENTYFRRDIPKGLRFRLDFDIAQQPVRYHLSVWERLGQFWLYFASFFGISFYIMDKVKDFLFGRHIIRSWEIIPWKKLY